MPPLQRRQSFDKAAYDATEAGFPSGEIERLWAQLTKRALLRRRLGPAHTRARTHLQGQTICL